jgi:hypothetical protein
MRIHPRPRLAAWAALLLSAAPLAAQARDTVVTAGADYDAGGPYAFLFGRGNQALWQTPLRVEVLDLGAFAGGLTPTKRGGGKQTKSLRFAGADGREYAFRSVRKDLPTLPPELRDVFAGRVVLDQLKSHHPAGPLVVAPLLDAVGVLNAKPRLVVMPDDPRLGEFRGEFAGMLGLLEERPDEGEDASAAFAGATAVISTERLLERLEEGPDDRVDARAYLRARLMDLLLGDWDRHQDQWRWARFGEARPRLWQPVPRDRDQAFVRFDGAALTFVRYQYPRVVRFGPEYRDLYGLTFSARALDRQLLAELPRAAWDSAVAAVQAPLTDAVLAAAVDRLPPEYRARDGARLAAALRARRDGLPRAADYLFRMHAREPEVRLTDGVERVSVDRLPGGALSVRAEAGGATTFARTFDPGETDEVRLYLQGGADTALVRGEGGGIRLRVIGGGGDDVLADYAPGGRTAFYDARGRNDIRPASGDRVDTREWTPPPPVESLVAEPYRDWGSRTYPVPWLRYRSDLGVVVGGGRVRYRYGFRQEPWASRTMMRAAVATGTGDLAFEYQGQYRRSHSRSLLGVRFLASQMEMTRFHGFGNDTELAVDDEDFYRVRQTQVVLEPALILPVSARGTLSIGPVAKWADTREDDESLDVSGLYGSGSFGQVGARAELRLDARDHAGVPTKGARFTLGGSAYPEAWDVAEAFGEAHAEAAAYASAPLPGTPTLALRAGGKRVWGDAPFHEAAYAGGAGTLRGFREQRFAGDAAVFGSAELRVALARFGFIFPGRLGVFGLADAGRVWLDGESPGDWHTGAGGGIWVQAMNGPAFTVSVASGEETRIYAGAGFAF